MLINRKSEAVSASPLTKFDQRKYIPTVLCAVFIMTARCYCLFFTNTWKLRIQSQCQFMFVVKSKVRFDCHPLVTFPYIWHVFYFAVLSRLFSSTSVKYLHFFVSKWRALYLRFSFFFFFFIDTLLKINKIAWRNRFGCPNKQKSEEHLKKKTI